MLASSIQKTLFYLLCLISSFAVCTVESSFAAPDPTEQFRPFLAKVVTKLAEPDLKQLPKKEQAQQMIKIVEERFDFQEMSKRVLNQQWRELSPQGQEEFQGLFTQLLQYVYVAKIEDYSGQQVKFIQQRMRGPRAEVQTELVDTNRSIAVSYLLMLENDQWMAYDVIVEGMSLVRNYRDQFKKIIQDDGYPELVKQVKSKISELEQQYSHK
nr:ABC transporter substrate-binding protein [uncultured Desulfobulbus sp.]